MDGQKPLELQQSNMQLLSMQLELYPIFIINIKVQQLSSFFLPLSLPTRKGHLFRGRVPAHYRVVPRGLGPKWGAAHYYDPTVT